MYFGVWTHNFLKPKVEKHLSNTCRAEKRWHKNFITIFSWFSRCDEMLCAGQYPRLHIRFCSFDWFFSFLWLRKENFSVKIWVLVFVFIDFQTDSCIVNSQLCSQNRQKSTIKRTSVLIKATFLPNIVGIKKVVGKSISMWYNIKDVWQRVIIFI